MVMEVIAVMTGNTADIELDYVNLRSQIAFGTRDWLKAGGMIPDHAKLQADLVTPKFTFDIRNRFKVQSKDEIKKVLKRSPDYGDALGLRIYNPPTVRTKAVDPPPPTTVNRWAKHTQGSRSW